MRVFITAVTVTLLLASGAHARTLTEQRIRDFQVCVGYDGANFEPVVSGQTEADDGTLLSAIRLDPRPALNAQERQDLAAIVVKVYNKIHNRYAIPTPTPIPTSTPTLSPTPTITVTPNGTVCGDGITFGTELCDDGNTASGDGCSGTCIPE